MKGVSFVTDSKDKKIAVQIDLKKYGKQLQPFLREVGISLDEDEYDEEFEKEWAKAVPIDEAFDKVHKYIDTLPWKK